MRFISENEIVCRDRNNAFELAKLLLTEHYAVMITEEEEFTVINYEYTGFECADRNKVVFMDREDFEEMYFGEVEPVLSPEMEAILKEGADLPL